ncbi:DUF1905 domain-containing protein [Tsukamurella tyrosinosolvens]|uniref:DUF1905 domain-containing protein n=1 Tax=Tsukamurella tyrosinosolvens TaxID=57704 RepID=UPI00079B2F40|nr:DUF1905 domain-containing protein [Tsukamurella tyrosinosolvens]KXP02780.1 hypothetical protein AXK59_20025 [Tsukamurella tyrosinosolvens]KZL96919.1 hypothetical protein AXX05_15665 [Tsukamurella tyrosinosolvens]MCA4997218.1 DUF1905 domain-containing protein [Tsukamurella tyrosinosolvens]QRY86294.1 DUF1905 domain-containing protein [Tsukamurella tyrosinosolvens]RDB46975.1 DUF1905 domain-containing protein [Tsukamurella tyrosinosolvens]
MGGVRGDFRAEIWLSEVFAACRFVALPNHLADEIADTVDGSKPGFGSVRVSVTIGATTWATSIFPDSGRGTYVLPLKKAVRAAEGVDIGDTVEVHLAVRD